MTELYEKEKAERLETAADLDAIANKLASITPRNRVLSKVVTKIKEAVVWYAKFLGEAK